MKASPSREAPSPSPKDLYERLQGHYGELGWWPADGPFQVMVGAVLTQRTAWRNVEMAMSRLVGAGIVDVDMLMALPVEDLEDLIRPSGTYRQKARRLRDLFSLVQTAAGGSVEAFLDRPVEGLREDLLSVRGIGPETADSIVLYAAKRPSFVVDAYTRRVLERVGIETGPSYEEVATWFTSRIPADSGLYGNYHATLVELAKDFCHKRPLCQGCPLADVCRTGRRASIFFER
jgi:endonuclease-3 related protein